MKPRRTYVLLSAAILFSGMALFFWVSAGLTRLSCCDLSWVGNAPDAETLGARLQVRDRALAEVARQKLQLRIYSLVSLATAVVLAIFYYRRRKRRASRHYVSAAGAKLPEETRPPSTS